MKDTARDICKACLMELHNLKKEICNQLSTPNRKLCWNKATEAQKKNTKYASALNDPCKCIFRIVTDKVKKHENV